MGKTMYLCVDFDGTVVDHCFPDIGAPVPGAIDGLKRFQKAGALIILFTMRSDGRRFGNVLTAAADYLEKNGIKLFGINENPDQPDWSASPKPFSHLYIDDAAVGCPLIHPEGFLRPCADWEAIGRIVKEQFGI
ncbi:MAG: hypothetical protein R2861_11925 [Desulfobacterales bacterium]